MYSNENGVPRTDYTIKRRKSKFFLYNRVTDGRLIIHTFLLVI